MKFNPSQAPTAYSQSDQNRFRELLRQFFGTVLSGDRDVELQPGVRLIRTSPDGTRWASEINNSGVEVWTAL